MVIAWGKVNNCYYLCHKISDFDGMKRDVNVSVNSERIELEKMLRCTLSDVGTVISYPRHRAWNFKEGSSL